MSVSSTSHPLPKGICFKLVSPDCDEDPPSLQRITSDDDDDSLKDVTDSVDVSQSEDSKPMYSAAYIAATMTSIILDQASSTETKNFYSIELLTRQEHPDYVGGSRVTSFLLEIDTDGYEERMCARSSKLFPLQQRSAAADEDVTGVPADMSSNASHGTTCEANRACLTITYSSPTSHPTPRQK
ncbi:hypothetical protein BV20DRAFT_142544 [Pilatotrama ljubarskyi]|nr:hypothetical protein BV20DRAFT_142544 [Pilatotrama ljubarskyi]